MLEKQKREEGDALISTILFDNVSEVLHDRVDLKKIEPMTGEDYYVRGCTALLDALGGAIDHIKNVHTYAREEDKPAKTLFVITTDGLENASRKYSYSQIQKMVNHRKEKDHWEFLFLGANIDAIDVAGRMGINKDCAVNYECDARGTAVNYDALANVVAMVRSAKACEVSDAFKGGKWKKNIEEDYETRHK